MAPFQRLLWPLCSSHLPIVFRSAISICRPSNLYSPFVSGQFHYICFARANKGWSHDITGICPWLWNCTVSVMTSMACRIVDVDFACSWRVIIVHLYLNVSWFHVLCVWHGMPPMIYSCRVMSQRQSWWIPSHDRATCRIRYRPIISNIGWLVVTYLHTYS